LGLALVAAGVFGSSPPQYFSTTASGSAAASAGPGAANDSGSDIQSACTDGAYSLNGHRWSGRFDWRFQASSRPKGFNAVSTANALRRAVYNIVNGDNNCGLPDLISATHWYRGTTSRAPNISSGAACLGRDRVNTIGFGTLPSGYLGMTCWWTYNGRVVEADVKLNKSYYKWYINRPSGCYRKWNIEAAATHEFGHVFGLGHVSESFHGSLTMSPIIKACQGAEATLGLGDVVGLRALY
jgi:Matrixin